MDVFVPVVLVVLVMSLPAFSWWGIMSQRKRQIDEAADRRMVDFVTRNAGTAEGHAPVRNPHPRSASLAEQYFEGMARNSPDSSALTHGDAWDDAASPQTQEGPSINPANGLPMLNSAVDVAGNPFGFDLHHGMSMQHPSDSFGEHGMAGHSIGHDFHSGHDAFGHSSSWPG